MSPAIGSIDVRPLRRGEALRAAALLVRRGLLAAEAAGTGEARIAALCDSPQADCLAAVDAAGEERLLGVALAVSNGFHVFLSHVAVAPEAERRGAGSALLAAVAERARARGAAGVVADARLAAAGFFARAGFRLPGAVFVIRDVRG